MIFCHSTFIFVKYNTLEPLDQFRWNVLKLKAWVQQSCVPCQRQAHNLQWFCYQTFCHIGLVLDWSTWQMYTSSIWHTATKVSGHYIVSALKSMVQFQKKMCLNYLFLILYALKGNSGCHDPFLVACTMLLHSLQFPCLFHFSRANVSLSCGC